MNASTVSGKSADLERAAHQVVFFVKLTEQVLTQAAVSPAGSWSKGSRKLEVEADFNGYTPFHFVEAAASADVVLFDPQVPWAIIDSLAYGRGDGETVLDQALALLSQ